MLKINLIVLTALLLVMVSKRKRRTDKVGSTKYFLILIGNPRIHSIQNSRIRLKAADHRIRFRLPKSLPFSANSTDELER